MTCPGIWIDNLNHTHCAGCPDAEATIARVRALAATWAGYRRRGGDYANGVTDATRACAGELLEIVGEEPPRG